MTSSPSQLARRINDAFAAGRIEELSELVHEKAEVASYLAPDTITGRDAVIDACRHARQDGIYEMTLYDTRELGPTVAVGTGSVRHRKDNHVIAQTQAAWLWKFEEGQLLRSAPYRSEDDAQSAYDPGVDDFEMP
jgi:hypothetical protein